MVMDGIASLTDAVDDGHDSRMLARDWLNRNDKLQPGTVVYASTRRFQLWAQTVSHGQLLLRSPKGVGNPTRVELMFKPVKAQKTRSVYDGPRIRCATMDEAAAILAETPDVLAGKGMRLYLIDSAGTVDWIVAMAVGWREDTSGDEVSAFTYHDEQSAPPIRTRVLDGADGGLAGGLADVDEVITAIRTGQPHSAGQHAHLHVIMVNLKHDRGEHTAAMGGFITRHAAEQYLASLPPRRDVRYWIEVIPVGIS